jgi:hypothetical protein
MSDFSVALWSTPMPWPISFAVHLWFVVTKNGVPDRYEVWATNGTFKESLIAKNGLPPESGFRTTYFDNPYHPKRTGKTTLLWRIEGGDESVVANVCERIVSSIDVYPYNKRYMMWPGPNSNSYVAWCLAPYPELRRSLPWNAFGKNFKKPL